MLQVNIEAISLLHCNIFPNEKGLNVVKVKLIGSRKVKLQAMEWFDERFWRLKKKKANQRQDLYISRVSFVYFNSIAKGIYVWLCWVCGCPAVCDLDHSWRNVFQSHSCQPVYSCRSKYHSPKTTGGHTHNMFPKHHAALIVTKHNILKFETYYTFEREDWFHLCLVIFYCTALGISDRYTLHLLHMCNVLDLSKKQLEDVSARLCVWPQHRGDSSSAAHESWRHQILPQHQQQRNKETLALHQWLKWLSLNW